MIGKINRECIHKEYEAKKGKKREWNIINMVFKSLLQVISFAPLVASLHSCVSSFWQPSLD